MQYLDIKILKKNIRKQMAKHGTTQEVLAKQLGMSQPNVSKALSLKDKKCFTLEQTIGISSYFNVPIDYLVGKRKADSIVSNQEIAQMLVALVESGTVSFDTITKAEQECDPGIHPPGEGTGHVKKNREVQYPVLYFRNYWIPKEFDPDFEQERKLDEYGNYTQNFDINDFLKKYIQIYEVYKNDGMDNAQYRDIVQGLLSKL